MTPPRMERQKSLMEIAEEKEGRNDPQDGELEESNGEKEGRDDTLDVLMEESNGEG